MQASLKYLVAAPHRVMFFCGAVQAVLTVAWWLVDLLARYAGLYAPVTWSIVPMWAHAYLMLYGIFPLFMFGFLMTAMPNWLGDVRVRRADYVTCGALMLGGMLLFYLGLVTHRALLGVAVISYLGGWAAGWVALARLLAASANPNRAFPRLLLGVNLLGWLGALGFLAWLATGHPLLLEAWRRGAVWFFLLPTFFSVSNRMVPFFSSRVLDDSGMVRPAWALPLMIAASFTHGVLELAGAQAWLWLADLPMLATVGYLGLAWGFTRSFRVRLLAVLHLSLAGLFVALLLYAAQSLTLLLTGASVLGAAPLHALTLGYFAAITIGMVSRVSLGHSGRQLTADTLTWACFIGVLVTAALRVVAELPALFGAQRPLFTVLAAALWLACLLPWAYRYVPMYWQPRIDQRPG